jgi:hypothetical protein
MSSIRSGSPGATRVCPHCKATVLETAAICPGCRHHLRFNTDASQSAGDEGYTALSVDGSISHKVGGEPCEYFVVLDIRDERDQQLARQVVGVGVLQPGEQRHLNVSVGMRPVRALGASRSSIPVSPSPAAGVKPPLPPPPAVESRLQPRAPARPPAGGNTGAAATGPGGAGPGATGAGSTNPRFRNFHKP